MCLCAFFGVHENSKMEHAFFSSFSPSDYPLKLSCKLVDNISQIDHKFMPGF